MNWFEVIKENRLATETITHTKVSDENKPELKERRCRDALKKKMGYLKTLHNHLESSYIKPQQGPMKPDYKVSNLYGDNYRKSIPEPYDHAIKVLDKIPEEVCCALLENIQNVVQKGKAHVNAHKDKPHDSDFGFNEDDLDFYVETESIEIDNSSALWETRCELTTMTDVWGEGDYRVVLWLSAKTDDEPLLSNGKWRTPFIEMDVHYPSRWNEDFDKENPPLNTRWDLLKSVVETLEL